MVGIFIYIMTFFLVSALLPSYLFNSSTDTDLIMSDSYDAISDIDSGSTISLTKIGSMLKMFFATPSVSGIPSIISWIVFLINYTIIFMVVIYGYNKARGITGS